MRTTAHLIALLSLAAAGAASAKNKTDVILSMCSSSDAVRLAKQVIHEKMLPTWVGRIEAASFMNSTSVESVATTRTDAPLRRVECRGTLSVEAWHGLDRTVDQSIQMTLANAPDVLAALPLAFSGPADRRRYNVPFVFSAQQQKNGELAVSVAGISQLQALLTVGFLKSKQDQMASSARADAAALREGTGDSGASAKAEVRSTAGGIERYVKPDASIALVRGARSAEFRLHSQVGGSACNIEGHAVFIESSRAAYTSDSSADKCVALLRFGHDGLTVTTKDCASRCGAGAGGSMDGQYRPAK